MSDPLGAAPAIPPAGAAAAGVAAIGVLTAAIAEVCVLRSAAWSWLIAAALLTVFCACVGIGVNGRPAGLIIDNRNVVSLSKLQAAAWSVIVMSALLTAAVVRIRIGTADPVAVAIPGELLAAMGISAVSLVATPVVLSVKSGDAAPAAQIAQTAARLGDDPSGVAPVGKVYARVDPGDAQWLDIFRGDEVSNAATPDLTKIQQFLITVVVLLVYGAGLWSAFGGPEFLPGGKPNPKYLESFPAFSDTMVWLIGISHAGYLAYKAAPHGQTANAPAPQVSPAAVG